MSVCVVVFCTAPKTVYDIEALNGDEEEVKHISWPSEKSGQMAAFQESIVKNERPKLERKRTL